VTLLDASGGIETLPLMSKSAVAEKIIDRLVTMLGGEPPQLARR